MIYNNCSEQWKEFAAKDRSFSEKEAKTLPPAILFEELNVNNRK
jgi:hypothetical protein